MTLFIGQSTYKSLNGRLDIYLMLWLANLNLPTASSFPDDVFCAPHSQHFSQPCFNSERLWALDQVIRIYLLRILKLTSKVQSMTSSTGPGGTAKPPGPQEGTRMRTENQLKAVFFSAVCCAVKSSDKSVPSAVDDAGSFQRSRVFHWMQFFLRLKEVYRSPQKCLLSSVFTPSSWNTGP